MPDTQGMQSKTHPMQPVPRGGSAIKVPSGGKGGSPEDSGPDKSVHGVPGGGRAKNTAYAVPSRNKPSSTAKEYMGMGEGNSKANAWPAVGNPTPGSSPQVNQQPRVPFDQFATQTRGSGQSFPYGSAKGGFGFDRLKQS